MASVVVTQEFPSDTNIVIEGDPGDIIYFLKEGRVYCSKNGKLIRELETCEVFGEQPFLYNTKRTATVTSIGAATVLSIDWDTLV